MLCRLGYRHASCKNSLVRKVLPIVSAGIVLILVDHIACEIHTCEYASAARIGKKGGIRQFGSRCLRITPDRPSCYRCISSELDLVFEESLKTITTGCDEDQV